MKKSLSPQENKIWQQISTASFYPYQQESIVRDLSRQFGLSPIMMRVGDEYMAYDWRRFSREVLKRDTWCMVYYSAHDCERITGSRAENWIDWSRVATGAGTGSDPDLLKMVAPAEVKDVLKSRGYPHRGRLRFLSVHALCFYLLAQSVWSEEAAPNIVRMKDLLEKWLDARHITAIEVQPPPKQLDLDLNDSQISVIKTVVDEAPEAAEDEGPEGANTSTSTITVAKFAQAVHEVLEVSNLDEVEHTLNALQKAVEAEKKRRDLDALAKAQVVDWSMMRDRRQFATITFQFPDGIQVAYRHPDFTEETHTVEREILLSS